MVEATRHLDPRIADLLPPQALGARMPGELQRTVNRATDIG